MNEIFRIMKWPVIPKPDFQNIEKVKNEVEIKKRKLGMGGQRSPAKLKDQKYLESFMQNMSLTSLENAYNETLEDTKKAIAEQLKILAITGELSLDKAKDMAKNYQVTSDFIYETFHLVKPKEKVIKILSIPKCADAMDSVEEYFVHLEKKDLYDYLCNSDSLGERKKIRLMTSAQLLERAKILYGQYHLDRDSNRKSAGEKLSTKCQEIFADNQSRQDYDYYIDVYIPVKNVLDKIYSLSDNLDEEGKVKKLKPEVGEALVSEINEIVRNVEESRAYLRGKCEETKITWIEAADSNIANCVFCGERISAEDEICGHCGKKQHIECPKCKKKVLANSLFCTSCGNKFGDAIKVSECCKAALLEIGKLNFSAAQYYIDLAEQEKIETDDLVSVRKKLKSEEENIGKSIRLLEDSQKEGLYYKASQLLNEIKVKYPSYRNDSLETICSSAISKAKDLFSKAVSTFGEKECLEYCAKIEQVCRDYPGVGELKEKFPPNTPGNVQVKPNNKNRINTISWEYSGLMTGIEFVVLRKEDARPSNIKDGKILGKFSAVNCIDRTPEAGKNYYYGVFACRGNKISNPGVVSAPLVNIYDIERLNIISGDSVVKLSWSPVKEGTVRVWRKDNGVFPQRCGDGVEITNVTESGVWDNSVRNGEIYGYMICVEYMTEKGNVYSTGIKARGIPEIPPQPVTYLLSEQDENNHQIFFMEWDADITDIVKFYGSPKELKWSEGASVAIDEIERVATELNISNKEHGKGILNLGNSEEMYVTAVTIGKESGVIGANVFVSNHMIFEILETKLVHGDIDISISGWPTECSALKVLYRSDRYPIGYSDKESECFTYTRAMFKASNSVVLKQASKENYYICIYGIYAGNKGYSPAVRTKYANQEKQMLCYAVRARKGIFGKVVGVTLSITSEQPTEIPELLVIRNRGYLPPNSSVGEKILEITAEREKRKSFEFQLGSSFQKDDYIRLFLKDSKDSSLFELNAVSDLNI